MLALKSIAWGAFALSGLAILLAFGLDDPVFIGMAVSLAVSGVFFLALDRMIELLTEIRDRLPARAAVAAPEAEPAVVAGRVPTQTVSELRAELDRLRQGA